MYRTQWIFDPKSDGKTVYVHRTHLNFELLVRAAADNVSAINVAQYTPRRHPWRHEQYCATDGCRCE